MVLTAFSERFRAKITKLYKVFHVTPLLTFTTCTKAAKTVAAVNVRKNKLYSQHHQAGEVGEGVVRDVADAVECQRECLQVPLMLQRHNWNLSQTVIIQPQVPELLQALETILRHQCDVVCIQASGEGQVQVKYCQCHSIYIPGHNRKKYYGCWVQMECVKFAFEFLFLRKNTY